MVRFAGLPFVAAVLVVLVGVPTRSQAQERLTTDSDVVNAVQVPTQSAVRSTEKRPAALLPLCASFATLQVLDIHSTRYGLEHGAVEGNRVMKGVTGTTTGMAAVKAAGTAGVIFISEKLRTKNKAVAIGLMIGTNSMMAWVVQHNYRGALIRPS
jgi:hypothetical protein